MSTGYASLAVPAGLLGQVSELPFPLSGKGLFFLLCSPKVFSNVNTGI